MRSVTPPPRQPGEPLREIPGIRKKGPTWQDEVRSRVRQRRNARGLDTDGESLPLFRDVQPGPSVRAPESPTDIDESPVASEPMGASTSEPPVETHVYLSDEEALDLPLRPAQEEAARFFEQTRFTAEVPAPQLWDIGAPQMEEPEPVERPAPWAERTIAALIDLSVLLVMWGIVLYFAGRIARAPIAGLFPTWPYLGGFLAALGFAYAVYFTGTTGQTLGKLAKGLRVVDTAGQPPQYGRALLRSVLGATGVMAAFVGVLPMFLDPARRALHDRLFKTRVILIKS